METVPWKRSILDQLYSSQCLKLVFKHYLLIPLSWFALQPYMLLVNCAAHTILHCIARQVLVLDLPEI
jgi:hypothetical protein